MLTVSSKGIGSLPMQSSLATNNSSGCGSLANASRNGRNTILGLLSGYLRQEIRNGRLFPDDYSTSRMELMMVSPSGLPASD
jgi:hypothetical protein